jgi:4-methyl-5(b-hydroxyethyl)-thiazole monophosphate biosynthesis
MNKKVLCLLIDGFEEIETIAPIDILRRAGAFVRILSVTNEPLVKGRSNIIIKADDIFNDKDNFQSYDMLLIPGGPGVKELRKIKAVTKLAQIFHNSGKYVAAICAAPLILLDAGILKDRKYTAHFSTENELPSPLKDEKVVIDHNVITSRGAGTSVEFGLALVKVLFGKEKSDEIAKAIMV